MSKLTNFFDKFFDLIFPSKIKCLCCDEELLDGESDFCDECKQHIIRNNRRVCRKCGQPIESNSNICYECRLSNWHFKIARAPFIYGGTIKKIIHKLKQCDALYLIKPLAKYMSDEIVLNNYKFDVVCAVPMTKIKEMNRGYNQSKLIAQQIAKNFGKECLDNCLVKTFDTNPQSSLKYKERQANLVGCFSAKNIDKFKAKSVLLVDDIFTTGATVEECSKVLIRLGAKEVLVVTFAHTILESSKKLVNNVDISI